MDSSIQAQILSMVLSLIICCFFASKCEEPGFKALWALLILPMVVVIALLFRAVGFK